MGVADHRPCVAAIVGAVERRLRVLDEGVHPVRVAARHGHRDLADRMVRRGHAVPDRLVPRRAAVARHVDAAGRAAAVEIPGMDEQRPHAGIERVRIARVHREVRAAGLVVELQHLLPRLAAVGRAIDAALRLRLEQLPQRADEHAIRIVRVDDDAADVAGFFEAHVLPVVAGVGRLVDAVAHRVERPDEERLAGPGPHGVGRGVGDRERADGGDLLVIEDRLPVHAAVLRLPDAARGRADVVHHRIPRLAGDGGGTVAVGPDEAPVQAGERIRLGRRLRADVADGQRRRDRGERGHRAQRSIEDETWSLAFPYVKVRDA